MDYRLEMCRRAIFIARLFVWKGGQVLNYFRSAIFIDGGYLDKILQYNNRAKIDYSKMCDALSKDIPLLRAYYYQCLPYQSSNPTEEERNALSNMERFLKKLSALNNFSVKKGKLAYRGLDTEGNPIFEQKRIDTYLATDLVMHSTKRLISHAFIITGDSDFIPAIEIAQAEGVSVTLVYSSENSLRPHDELLDMVDSRLLIKPDLLIEWQR